MSAKPRHGKPKSKVKAAPLTKEKPASRAVLNAFRRIADSAMGLGFLSKACWDEDGDYAVRLRSGEVVIICGVLLIDTIWVRLYPKAMSDQPCSSRIPFVHDNGMDVRIDDIVWIMDASDDA